MMEHLYEAIKNNDVQAVSRILDQAPYVVEVYIHKVYTPLTYAAEKGHMEVASLLLDRGASVTATDRNVATVVHKAAGQGHYELMELFLRRGADAGKKDVFGMTALMHASAEGRAATVRRLIPHISKVELDEWDCSRQTALHKACANGHPEVVRILLLAGLNSNAADKWGRTPRACAIGRGHQTCAAVFDVSAYRTRLCLMWAPHGSATYKRVNVACLGCSDKSSTVSSP